jgi:hypothetical protein
VIGPPDLPLPLIVEIQPRNLTGRVNLLDALIHLARQRASFSHKVKPPRRDVAMAMGV